MAASSTELADLIDREIVLSRVIDAPRELVFQAWTDPDHITRWFGPDDFSCTTHAMDLRAGGTWRFDMLAPDGTLYPNRIDFLTVQAPSLLVFEHGTGEADDPNRFRVTVTFDVQDEDTTVLTLRQLHPTKARRIAAIGFGAVRYGYQTLGKLAAHLLRM
jgi:uncharacterized protein YndB with AHSA1/START domain